MIFQSINHKEFSARSFHQTTFIPQYVNYAREKIICQDPVSKPTICVICCSPNLMIWPGCGITMWTVLCKCIQITHTKLCLCLRTRICSHYQQPDIYHIFTLAYFELCFYYRSLMTSTSFLISKREMISWNVAV